MAIQGEMRAALAEYRSAFLSVLIIGAVLNVLLLGGSIYMMLIYDSVLPSHSVPTLVGLLLMVIVVYLFQGFFDTVRTRIVADVGMALDRKLSNRVQRAISEMRLRGARVPGDGLIAMRDLDQIRNFLGSPGPAALADLPWILFFLLILFLMHVWLGVTALVGTLVLAGLTILTDRATREPTQLLTQVGAVRNGIAESNLRHVEVLTALGMRSRMQSRWEEVNHLFQQAQNRLSHITGLLGGTSKIFRLFLQSAVLTVGALLVIDGKATGGIIFASSILAGRALAPVDAAIGNWRNFTAARQGWKRLNDMLAHVPDEPEAMVILPAPTRELAVQQLYVTPPGTQKLTVQGVDFRLTAGNALGVVGPSAAGKTSLARALIGVWPPARGNIRLDGATLDQWPGDLLGEHIGYLPQTVELLEGTVAENIARFAPESDSAAIIAAAQAAGVHDLIVSLPQGYETPVGADGAELSAGQRQRIGLARALYGDPFLVLLDEPNSNLDAMGEAALEQAIAGVKARGGIAIVIAHRPSALAQADYVLFMRDGRAEAFGPRDDVLKKITKAPQQGRVSAASAATATAGEG